MLHRSRREFNPYLMFLTQASTLCPVGYSFTGPPQLRGNVTIGPCLRGESGQRAFALIPERSALTKLNLRTETEIAARVLKHWHEAVPDDRMAHLVKDATRAFQRSLQVRLAAHDVQMGHWTFLRILWNREGITQRELSLEAGFMESTTVVALRAMEALGYVTRERRATNRKNVYVFLTAKGKKLKKLLVPLASEVNALATTGLAEEDVAAARRALLAMIDNLTHDSAIIAEVASAPPAVKPPAGESD
ncbi:hypothetical protein BH09PSE5_BH09PSE5_29400 [soil metagenome]